METKILKLTSASEPTTYQQSVAKGKLVVEIPKYGIVILADAKDIQQIRWSKPNFVTEVPSDVDLLKAWHHATIERKFGVYATKPHLQNELEKRGYLLSENKHRWLKSETV